MPPVSSKIVSITGGRGRLAALLADHLRTPLYETRLFSRTAGSGFQALTDLVHPSSYEKTNLVLHLAWSTLPAISEQQPRIEWERDLPLLEKMLNALTQLPVRRRPHFVFFSSGGTVYGNAPGRANQESDPCQPIGWHGRAKRAAEEMIEAHTRRTGLKCTILRISNPYGYPVPKSRAQGLIPHTLRCAMEGQPISLWGDGSAQKDFLYYTDLLSALDQVIARRPPGTFNIGAGSSHRVSEVISLVEQHTGRAVAVQRQAAPSWDVQDSRLDIGRFVAATGWRPQVALTEGIRRAAGGYVGP